MFVICTEPEPYGPAIGVDKLSQNRRSAMRHGRATDPADAMAGAVR
jgi:hypothetical protein